MPPLCVKGWFVIVIRFLHAADIHLGYQQYNSRERYNDFARAFEAMVDDALARQIDFALLAGDLFNKRSIEPRTLLQATSTLQRLRDAGIPVIVIEGNHERSHYQDRFSWLDFLCEAGLVILLDAPYEDGQLQLLPWDDQDKMGSYIELPDDVRVVGVKYHGAGTPRVVQDLITALPETPALRSGYRILMLHAGLEGVLDHYAGTVTRALLDQLHPYVDYMALGHIHKPFIQDDWIYNPGSLETNSVDEVQWPDRGYFIVEVDPSRPSAYRHLRPAHTALQVRSERRRFERLSFSVDQYKTPTELYNALAAFLSNHASAELIAQKPVVELRLTGILAFAHVDLVLAHVEEMVNQTFQPIVCNLKDLTAPSEFEIRLGETMTHADLERHVLCELLERDVRRREDSARWTDMILSLKQMSLAGTAPEEIISRLELFAGGNGSC